MSGSLPASASAGSAGDAIAAPKRERALAWALLFAGSYVFRLPPLLNARSTNSDAAVVGLQAIHVLRGEHAAFLWGSGYQTAADAYVAAGFFALLGSTPFALMLSALTLHVVATAFVYATLARRFRPLIALLLSLPLVLAPSSVHTYALYPPRQLSITLALGALWALDAAGDLRTQLRWLGVGAALYGLAVSADPYPMVLAPIVLAQAALALFDVRRRRRDVLRAIAAGALGACVGLVPFAFLHRAARASSGQMGLSLAPIAHNWKLMIDECLPWALSYKVYFARDVMNYEPWDAPLVVRAVQLAGASIVGVVVLVGLVGIFRRSIDWRVRRLGFAGAAVYPVALGAFLVSVMVMDHFSMRYLAVLTLLLPFAAATPLALLGPRRTAVVLAPHLIAGAIGGWVGYGPFVRGPLPVRETPELRDDFVLESLLRARGIEHAQADYWTSYRLTLLYGERIVVVPTNESEDRYPPYRRALLAAPRYAYVFDPGRSRENLEETERRLRRENAEVEATNAGRLKVFLVRR